MLLTKAKIDKFKVRSEYKLLKFLIIIMHYTT